MGAANLRRLHVEHGTGRQPCGVIAIPELTACAACFEPSAQAMTRETKDASIGRMFRVAMTRERVFQLTCRQ